jgi:Fur family transcriptional regulator, ferric uptake regulator
MRQNLKIGDDVEARFRVVLRGHGLKWTSERQHILLAALTRAGHFTADDLVRDLKKSRSAASRATVYRALPLLVEAGLVQAMVLAGEGRRYENATGRHHDHLVCSSCGKVIEFEFEAFEILQREIAAKYGFELLGHVHELLGHCGDCRASAKPS